MNLNIPTMVVMKVNSNKEFIIEAILIYKKKMNSCSIKQNSSEFTKDFNLNINKLTLSVEN